MENLESLALLYKRAQNQIGDGLSNVTKQDLILMFNNYDSQDDTQVPLYFVSKEVTLLDRLSGLPTNIQVQRFKKDKVACVMLDIEKVKDKQSLYDLFEGLKRYATDNLKTTFFLGLVASTTDGLNMYKKTVSIQDVASYTTVPHHIDPKES